MYNLTINNKCIIKSKGKRKGKHAPTRRSLSAGDHQCRFSIFFCGCKQPKSVHIV